MKVFVMLVALLLALAACSRQPPYLPQPGLREEIEFVYDPSFRPLWVVHLERDSRGVVSGKVYKGVQSEDREDHVSREQRKSFEVPAATFDRLVGMIESKELKEVSERFPMIGNDGVSFEFTRRMGNRRLHYSIWWPTAANPNTKLAVALADAFLQAAGISSLANLVSLPNQPSEPTAMSVTPPAAQEPRQP